MTNKKEPHKFENNKELEDFLLNKIKEWSDKSKSTSGHKKMIQYFNEVIKSEYFRNKLREIRKKYQIPITGFTENIHYPIYPKEWIFRKDIKTIEEIEKEIKDICQKFHLHYIDWREPIDEMIFYNKYSMEFAGYNCFNLCAVRDLTKNNNEKFSKESEESDDMAYPIAIRVSPYASLRDILDFVKQHSILIQGFQNKYKDKEARIGKERRKKTIIQERNEFIYQHKDLTRRKIMSLITDKFGSKNTIDYGYIGKIISLEKKRRKEM